MIKANSSPPIIIQKNKEKFLFLESIRGLAALAVVFAHIMAAYYPGVATNGEFGQVQSNLLSKLFYGLPFGFMISGHFAVVLFFTLSGFVLTYKFFKTKKTSELHLQAAKRYIRLAIPIFTVVMFSYFMISTGMMENIKTVAKITGSPELLRIFTFQPDFFGAVYDALIGVFKNGDYKYNPVLWTMPIELFGSFIIFGLAFFASSLRKKWIFYTISIILLSNTYYVCFILGMLLADLVNSTNFVNFQQKKIHSFYKITALIFVWIIASFPDPLTVSNRGLYGAFIDTPLNSTYIYNLWQFAAAFILIALLVSSQRLQKVLNKNILVYIGGLSFAIYLTHYLILQSLGNWVFIHFYHSYNYRIAALIAALVTIIVTLLVSSVWKKYVDDLSVKMSRLFASSILK